MAVQYNSGGGEAGAPHRAALAVRRIEDRPGVHVSGEVCLSTQTEWQQTLDRLTTSDEDVHMDLSRLTFVDVAGASSLARAAQRLPMGRRIVVSNPPASLVRSLDLFWPDLCGIEVAK
ncbi:STAS domain-containing protein [Streptomyces sp. SP18CS02]|uniref:STAS domain-containing protein n=1 Tax=Streptomyces sp. SP18CS02 TaxID=3002531 RepID=UPI002E7A6BB0|nr:STAS domain-containing protein [Streptomyces sp. SP18CS02]MEE1757426.1 STAS domain-containing protein [Streptomyces sp. SP18CS02]